MRAEDVSYARCGDIELQLAPRAAAIAHVSLEDPKLDELDEREERRRTYATLLHSSGADISPFLGDS